MNQQNGPDNHWDRLRDRLDFYTTRVGEVHASMRDVFDAFCYLESPEKIQLAKDLCAQQGEVDYEVEGLSSAENQRGFTVQFHWGHDHIFNESFNVFGEMAERHTQTMAEFMVGYDLDDTFFKNKSIFDVGVWTGGTSLMLYALGAEKVTGIEEVRKYAKTAEALIKDIYDIQNYQCLAKSLYEFNDVEAYDIVYVPGVIYHLSDPVLALRKMFNALKDGGVILIESEGVIGHQPVCAFAGNRATAASATSGSQCGWNWFIPTAACLEEWMMAAGFENVECVNSAVGSRIIGIGTRKQFVPMTKAGLSDQSLL